ncbi:hypothetical protein [Methanohalobium sp.]
MEKIIPISETNIPDENKNKPILLYLCDDLKPIYKNGKPIR